MNGKSISNLVTPPILKTIAEKIRKLPYLPMWEERDTPGFAYGVAVVVKKLNPAAVIPTQARVGDAGFDLTSVEEVVIPPQSRAIVGTGIAVAMDGNIELQIRPRSGLAAKHGITVLNSPGTIDSGYRGELKVVLFNSSKEDFKVSVGDRIAQGVFAFLPTIHIEEAEELPSSERGEGGFGSTGT